MPVAYQNTTPGPIVFHDPLTKQQQEWAGSGDPSGRDIQHVPDDFGNNVYFLKAVNRGLLTVVKEEVAMAAANQSHVVDDGLQAAALADARSVLTRKKEDDIIQVDCVGPSGKGRGDCGKPAIVKERDRNAVPPLCEEHKALSGEFVASTGNDNDPKTGKATVTWARTVITRRPAPQ